MMTSSNGNIFRVTGPLCGEFTGPGEFPTQRPVTRSFDVFFDLYKRLSKQPWGWWFETLSWTLWRHCNEHTNTRLNCVMLCFVVVWYRLWFHQHPQGYFANTGTMNRMLLNQFRRIWVNKQLLLTWFNFNPGVDKVSHSLSCVGSNYLSIAELQRWNHWIWEWKSDFIPHFHVHVITYPCWD